MDKMEEVGYLDTQIVTFPNDLFNSNRIVFSDGTVGLLSTDGLTIGELGLNLVNIPIQIVQDPPIQQHVLTTEIVPENTTIYIDPSQLAYLSNGQVVITDEGLINTLTEQANEKQNIYFTPSTETIKHVGELNSIDLTCLDGTADTLFEGAVDLEEQRVTAADTKPSPDGEELVISASEVGWNGGESANNLNTQAATPPPPKKDNGYIPPPLRKGPFKCEICFKEIQLYSQFRKHQQFHLDDKPHKCNSCSASFNNVHNLWLHSATHLNSLQCPECQRSFSRAASFKAHIMLHEREESLFCTECGDEFPNQVQLDKHKASHDEEWVKPAARVYQCTICEKQYARASVLRQHMKDHFKVKAAMSAKSYKRAVRKGRVLHTCTVCGKNFQKPSQLTRHTRIHTGEKPYKCDMCVRSFNQKGSLLIHMMSKHKGMRPYSCQFCSATFSQKGNLRSHVVRLHSIPKTEETVYQCSECSCVFRKLGSLNAHHNRMHPNVQITAEPKKAIEIHQQKKAQRAKDTSDKENDILEEDEDDPVILKQEGQLMDAKQCIITVTNKMDDGSVKQTTMKQRQVGSIKWHQCTYCGKEFKKPSDLVRHTRIHTQERPYKCKLCMRAFSVRSTLMTHIKTHSSFHKCGVCGKVCSSAMLLKYHKRTHHPSKSKKAAAAKQPSEAAEPATELPDAYAQPLVITDQGVMQVVSVNKVWNEGDRPHKCGECGQAFRKARSLKTHVLIHNGERPYSCSLCPRTFKSTGVLKSHMRTHTMLKTHRCNECGKYLSTKSSLRRHMAIHVAGHPFLCPYCPRTFKTHGASRKHIKTHKLILTQVVDGDGNHQQMFEVQGVVEGEGDAVEEHDQDGLIQVQTVEESSLPTIPDLGSDLGGDDGVEEEVGEQEMGVGVSVANIQVPNIEALIVNRANMNFGGNTILSAEEPYIISTVEGDERTVASQTLHADASGTITLPQLTGQDTLTQESIREIEESLNQQLFCTTDLTLDKDQVVLFDQGFESCVFPSITLQGEQLELGPTLTSASLASIINNSRKALKTFRCKECGAQCKSSSDLETHRLSHPQLTVEKDGQTIADIQAQTITLADTEIEFEEDANLESIETDEQPEHSCYVCSYVARDETDLAEHKAKHRTCEICEKSFSTAAAYKAHVRSHGREKEFECELCGSAFTQQNSLVRHMAIHDTPNTSYACEVCGHQCRSEAQLRRHTSSTHRGDRPRRRGRGDVRQLTEQEAEELARQEATSVSERVLKASLAEKDRISDVKDLDSVKNEPQFPNQCKYCPKSFRKPSDLVRHLRIHTGERPFQCEYCCKCFTVKSTLDSHMKTHNNQNKRSACHICGYFFATKGSLKVHMRLHTGSRPFRCPVCFQRFRTSGHRKAHLMLHVRQAQPQLVEVAMAAAADTDPSAPDTTTAVTLELDTSQQPVCSICEKTFTKMCYLTRHMRVHTGEKPFQCKECNKKFTQKNSLDTHMLLHTGERSWACVECGIKFTQKCNLTAHVQRHHLRPPPPYTIDLSEEKFPVDFDKVVSDLFSQMKNQNDIGTVDI